MKIRPKTVNFSIPKTKKNRFKIKSSKESYLQKHRSNSYKKLFREKSQKRLSSKYLNFKINKRIFPEENDEKSEFTQRNMNEFYSSKNLFYISTNKILKNKKKNEKFEKKKKKKSKKDCELKYKIKNFDYKEQIKKNFNVGKIKKIHFKIETEKRNFPIQIQILPDYAKLNTKLYFNTISENNVFLTKETKFDYECKEKAEKNILNIIFKFKSIGRITIIIDFVNYKNFHRSPENWGLGEYNRHLEIKSVFYNNCIFKKMKIILIIRILRIFKRIN